jgi:hypothetical protein
MATANEEIKANITLLKNKTSKYYDKINELMKENNSNLETNVTEQLGKKNMNYSNVDIIKIRENTNKINKLLFAVNNNLTEMMLLVRQLEPISLSEQDIINYTAAIEVAKNTPISEGDI